MIEKKNFTDNDDITIIAERGIFKVIEYRRDLSVEAEHSDTAFFCNAMNVRKRQLVCDGQNTNIIVQSGAMQWTAGNVKTETGIKGIGDFIGKAVQGTVTGESVIKPEYSGGGTVVLEPTYRHILLIDPAEWGGAVVLDDGLFLACDASLKYKVIARRNLSSAAAGGEGLFNLCVSGNGVLCLESPCPKEELVEIELSDDVLKVDGNMAVLWSESLDFTVERSGKTLTGSAASGEGLVNVYRGTGRIWIAPVQNQLGLLD